MPDEHTSENKNEGNENKGQPLDKDIIAEHMNEQGRFDNKSDDKEKKQHSTASTQKNNDSNLESESIATEIQKED